MTSELVEQREHEDGRIYPLQPTTISIGRGEDNGIRLANQRVSRIHARICWDGARFILSDCGSRNGTTLNGQPLHAPQQLTPGDRIVLGGGVTLVFRTDETAPWERAPLRIDLAAARVWLDEQPVHLTKLEYRALTLLHQRRGQLVSKDQLAAQVWSEVGGVVADDTLVQLMARLRRKLETDSAQRRCLDTVRGLGYRLLVP